MPARSYVRVSYGPCCPVKILLVVLNFSFLGRACQRNYLASLVTASVMPQPIVARENCLGLRIVTSSGHGIVCDQYCVVFPLENDVFPVLWLFGHPPQRLHNLILHHFVCLLKNYTALSILQFFVSLFNVIF